MVEGRLPPKVKRDAHDVILEFIRSRPPLKPVSSRSGVTATADKILPD